MKLVCLGDTHGFHSKVNIPYGDVLIHVGDITRAGEENELFEISRWFHSLPHPCKILVAGNHDWCFQRSDVFCREILGKSVSYLRDEELIWGGFKFYGSPWQPKFLEWAFNLPRDSDELKARWEAIPNDTDVLITHGPPFMVMDMTTDAVCCGCRLLRDRIIKIRPQCHVFGHIHEGYGYQEDNGIRFANVSICDLKYRPTRSVQIIELSGATHGRS
jgi:predicted phosphohydrolase